MEQATGPALVEPERRKRPGVYYALTDSGLELPIVDVTHPAFAVSLSEEEQRARVAEYMQAASPFGKLPKFVRQPLLRFLLRGSVLGRAIGGARSSFLSGMNTYLLKLGPENLGDAYAKPIDRKIAAALPSFALRLRVSDLAHLLAAAARAALETAPPERPLHLLDIAGGPAVTSLNALILLQRESARLLAGRHVEISVLDQDAVGPRFGARALAALSAPGAPLAGIDARLERVHYDWSNPTELVPVLEDARTRGAVTLAASEGGLFEYGSDEEIVANLETLRAGTGPSFAMVGSVTRADEPMQRMRRYSQIPTRPRGLPLFRPLVERAGFRLENVIERPFSDHVTLATELSSDAREADPARAYGVTI
jgi:hypothetical protein